MECTREQSFNTRTSLQPAAVFLDAYQERAQPAAQPGWYLEPPEEFFIAPDSPAHDTEGHLIPLLDDGCFCTVALLTPARAS